MMQQNTNKGIQAVENTALYFANHWQVTDVDPQLLKEFLTPLIERPQVLTLQCGPSSLGLSVNERSPYAPPSVAIERSLEFKAYNAQTENRMLEWAYQLTSALEKIVTALTNELFTDARHREVYLLISACFASGSLVSFGWDPLRGLTLVARIRPEFYTPNEFGIKQTPPMFDGFYLCESNWYWGSL